jgi:hypothetical protein
VVTPLQNTNHRDWQGESSGLAGQSKILNNRMYRVIKVIKQLTGLSEGIE